MFPPHVNRRLRNSKEEASTGRRRVATIRPFAVAGVPTSASPERKALTAPIVAIELELSDVLDWSK